ncbi:MAG: SDR family oxidoreductase [Rhodospirillales bacterium]
MAAPTVRHPERAEIFRRAIAMNRFGRPEEMIGAAIFLASEAGSYVNGHMIHVDGGVRRRALAAGGGFVEKGGRGQPGRGNDFAAPLLVLRLINTNGLKF